jgi:hypothetical protein
VRRRGGRHLGEDGWLSDVSVGQVCAAITAEAGALGIEATTVRVVAPSAATTPSPWPRIAAALIFAALLALVLWIVAASAGVSLPVALPGCIDPS